MRYFVLCSALFFGLQISSQNQDFLKIDSILKSKVDENHPGIAVGILKDGNIIYEKYFGLSNLQHKVKFDEKTRSNIASTAKQFTALMILDLSLNEKLSLEDDIRKYLPKLYKNVNDKIKLRHLLNHTSGIRDYVELLDLEGDVWWKRVGLDNDAILELIENQEELGFTPGSQYSYSNTNYVLLTKIIEKISGKTFNVYSKNFFENLGMNETSFVEGYMKVIPNRANPYSDWGRGEWWEVPTVTKTNGEGFLFTTLKNQLTFEKAVQNANHNNNVLLIKSQQPIPNSEIKTYGFGLELEDKLGRKAMHHSGGTYGFHSQTYRFPKEQLTIFAMSNNGNISTNLIAQEIAKILLPKSENKIKYDSKFYKNSEANDVIVLGKYTYPLINKIVEIINNEGKTFWKEKNFTVEMVSEDKNLYSFTNNKKLKVRFYRDIMVEYYPSGKTMTYSKVNDEFLSKSDLENLVGNYYNKALKVGFDLKLNEKNELQFKLSSNKGFNDVTFYNRKYGIANNFFLKVERDLFDRVIEISLTYGRAHNIRFRKKTNLKFQPKISTENGSIEVTTIGSKKGNSSTILLTKNYANGNEIWYKKFGGSSYDKASSIIDTEDGYLIIGSTSSYGKGNYDMFAIKTDKKGKKLWQNTFGGFYNEYGYTAEKTKTGFIVKGTKQNCPNNTDINRNCITNVWFVTIDKNGKEVSNQLLEEIKH